MANLPVKKDDGTTTVYLKASGAGSDGDPFVLDRTDSALNTKIGEVQASPTANTVLDRLKALLTGIVLAAGTNAIGKLAANSGVDIGDVDVASIAAGTNLIGKVSIDQATANANEVVVKNRGGISISQTPTITAGAYSAKDAVGGLLTFANAARVSGGASVLNSVTIVDNDSENAQLELWLFNADPTVVADNAAFDISDANMAKLVGVVPISSADYYALADNGAASVRGVGLQFDCAATSLYGQLKCVGTPTYTATSDLIVILAIEYLD